jgi:hypothetical protein
MRVDLKRHVLRLAALATAGLVLAWGHAASAVPQIGYAYPAGGQRGTTFTVEVGGQGLRGVDAVRVSGTGVQATVVTVVPALSDEDLWKASQFLRDLVRRRWSARAMEAVKNADEPALPDHLWLRDLDTRTPAELERLRARLFDPRKQPNAQIAEQVIVAVTIAPDAVPGDRELRLAAPEGVSNPLCFQVGVLPEISEADFAGGPAARVLEVPVQLNGQITPGETDRVSLRLRQGLRLVIRLQARHLIPYLADAVPGWFQAVMALYGPDGREVAWNDDDGGDPDPTLLYEVPADGVYELAVHDAIYRGRDDFVYRIAVGELPLVTAIFPLGGREDVPLTVSVRGWNLPAETLSLDTQPGGEALRSVAVGADRGPCSPAVGYAVDTLPEGTETEPNDTASQAQEVAFPQVVNGRIGRPGDVDVFRFSGQAGQAFVAEVVARRLNSPLDSVLRLVDAEGTQIALNDDCKDPELGLLTHQADSSVRLTLPRAGVYRLYLADVQRQGGEAYAYRLRLRPAQPDVALRLVPSCINLRSGQTTSVLVQALRKDGFDGPIDLALLAAPEGCAVGNTQIPAGKNSVEMRFTAPQGAGRRVFPVRLEGRAEIAGVMVRRPVVAAEDMMQAFLWRFLVPQREVLVAVAGSRPLPTVWLPLVPGVRLASTSPVRIPLGGTARVEIAAPAALDDPSRTALAALRFRLGAACRGVTLQSARVEPTGVVLTLKADANTAWVGDVANAMVEASVEPPAGDRGDPLAGRLGPLSLGVLPPVPFEVVSP